MKAGEKSRKRHEAELAEWDRTMVDGSGEWTTGDWPGWGRYVDLNDWPFDRPRPGEPRIPKRDPIPLPLELPGAGHHIVYRLWDEDDLLYVGVTSNGRERVSDHRGRWIFEVTWEEYPTREAAEWAEKVAIRDEHPIHNVMGAVV